MRRLDPRASRALAGLGRERPRTVTGNAAQGCGRFPDRSWGEGAEAAAARVVGSRAGAEARAPGAFCWQPELPPRTRPRILTDVAGAASRPGPETPL